MLILGDYISISVIIAAIPFYRQLDAVHVDVLWFVRVPERK